MAKLSAALRRTADCADSLTSSRMSAPKPSPDLISSSTSPSSFSKKQPIFLSSVVFRCRHHFSTVCLFAPIYRSIHQKSPRHNKKMPFRQKRHFPGFSVRLRRYVPAIPVATGCVNMQYRQATDGRLSECRVQFPWLSMHCRR